MDWSPTAVPAESSGSLNTVSTVTPASCVMSAIVNGAITVVRHGSVTVIWKETEGKKLCPPYVTELDSVAW